MAKKCESNVHASNPIRIDQQPVEAAELQTGSVFSIGQTLFELRLADVPGGTRLIDTRRVLSSDASTKEPGAPRDPAAGEKALAQEQPDGGSGMRSSVQLLEELSGLLSRTTDPAGLAQECLKLICKRLQSARGFLARVCPGDKLDVTAQLGFPLRAAAPGTRLPKRAAQNARRQAGPAHPRQLR
jgi:hypothetical protein